MILGATAKTQQAVRLSIKSTDESGEQQHVIKVASSTLAEGLDERRLRITIDTAGIVTQVGWGGGIWAAGWQCSDGLRCCAGLTDGCEVWGTYHAQPVLQWVIRVLQTTSNHQHGANHVHHLHHLLRRLLPLPAGAQVGNSPTSLFGFKPAALLGRSLADCVDVLHTNVRAASSAAHAAGGNAAAQDAAATTELRKVRAIYCLNCAVTNQGGFKQVTRASVTHQPPAYAPARQPANPILAATISLSPCLALLLDLLHGVLYNTLPHPACR